MFFEDVIWFKIGLNSRNWFFISFSVLLFAFWSSRVQSGTVVCSLDIQASFDFDSQLLSLASQGCLFQSNLCLAMRMTENSTKVPNTRRSDVKRCTPNLFNLDSFGLSAYKWEIENFVCLTVKNHTLKLRDCNIF